MFLRADVPNDFDFGCFPDCSNFMEDLNHEAMVRHLLLLVLLSFMFNAKSQTIPVRFSCSGAFSSADSVMITARNLKTNLIVTFLANATLTLSGQADIGDFEVVHFR